MLRWPPFPGYEGILVALVIEPGTALTLGAEGLFEMKWLGGMGCGSTLIRPDGWAAPVEAPGFVLRDPKLGWFTKCPFPEGWNVLRLSSGAGFGGVKPLLFI